MMLAHTITTHMRATAIDHRNRQNYIIFSHKKEPPPGIAPGLVFVKLQLTLIST